MLVLTAVSTLCIAFVRRSSLPSFITLSRAGQARGGIERLSPDDVVEASI